MKITNSDISLSSQHTSVERNTVRESLRVQTGTSPSFENQSRLNNNNVQPASIVSISDAARTAQNQEIKEIKDAEENAENDPKMQLILRMVEAITGKKIELTKMKDAAPNPGAQQNIGKVAQATESGSQQRQVGPSIEYDRNESHYEAEQTTFSAQGSIRTADGKDIQFQLTLQMQREFIQESNVSIRAGDVQQKDPLVINFNGASAQLTDTKFAFDIDSDGKDEQISFTGLDSGFIALDKNHNGKIDNGTELFGTQSGNGFADLARYDSDGNKFIDENDAIYADLRILSKNASGQDELSTLAQRNVGALYLGSTSTPFSINGENNTSLGTVRSSGIYLTDDDRVGTLQQVDLSV